MATAASKAPAAKNGFSLISGEKLTSLYATMLKCRLLDDRVRRLFAEAGCSGDYDSSTGHEAAVVGVAMDLLPEDAIGPSHRDLIATFVKGVPLDKLLRQLKVGAGNGPLSPGIGYPSQIEIGIATGLALANKLQNNNKIAVAFLGGKSGTSSDCHEALHFAGAHQLPILFVCHSHPGAKDIALENHDVPRITVDGSDVVAVYRVACEAATHARKGNGPTLIECLTYRLNGNSRIGADKRPDRQNAPDWKDNDPILRMERYLEGKGLFHEGLKAGIIATFARDLDAAIEAVGKPLRPKGAK